MKLIYLANKRDKKRQKSLLAVKESTLELGFSHSERQVCKKLRTNTLYKNMMKTINRYRYNVTNKYDSVVDKLTYCAFYD